MKPYYSDSHVTIYHGDCREVLPLLDAASVQTCVTSPPYFGLRDYGGGAWVGGDEGCDHKSGRFSRGGLSEKQRSNAGSNGDEAQTYCPRCGAMYQTAQIGLEPTPAAYVAEMTGVFEHVRRVLRSDGTAWLNLGDSYNTPMGGATNPGISQKGTRVPLYELGQGYKKDKTLKPKDLIGIPWRVAFALQEAGWWLRSDIIWAKGNPMPESVQDRPTKAHEYLFLLAKAEKYYYDAAAIAEQGVSDHGSGNGYKRPQQLSRGGRGSDMPYTPQPTRNRRSVWTINTQPYAGAHFAVFPEKLIEPCILAGCPPGGVVLDPFGGSGTTGRVAKRLGRRSILIEQNERYCDMAAASLVQQAFEVFA